MNAIRTPRRAGAGRIVRTLAASAALLLVTPAPALTPPEPFVRDADGVTRLTMKQAGILRNTSDSHTWATVLGKAFFWDQQTGSDGQACASCHFHAGADTRLKNQLNPGFNDISKNGGAGDNAFGSTRSDTGAVSPGILPSGALADSNVQLKPGDFPLHRLAAEADRNAAIVTTTNDRVGSQGTGDMGFRRVRVLGFNDTCGKPDPTIFHAGSSAPASGLATRQTTARNAPTTINAAFSFRNFWDARANNLFNGVGVFGSSEVAADPNKRLVVLVNGVPTLGSLQLENASLASQAVGPVLSDVEASCDGRSFADVARKLYLTLPLLGQTVSPSDSVLGPHVALLGKGLKLTNLYPLMIQRAFDPKYWSAPGKYRIVNGALVADPRGHTQMELNFPMFWGISIMLYESRLTSDQSEFDTLVAAGKLTVNPLIVPVDVVPAGGGTCTGAADVDPLLVRGCQIWARFTATGGPARDGGPNGGNCFLCHNSGGLAGPTPPGPPPMLAQSMFQKGDGFPLMLQVPKAASGGAIHRHDAGQQNIGVRPFHTDLFTGANNPYGLPLSFSRQYQRYLSGALALNQLDRPLQRAIAANDPLQPLFGPPGGAPGVPAPTLGVDAASKTPSLRNVALTPPYFSWGGYADLRQAMKVYNRGMNRRDITPASAARENAPGGACASGDDSGTGPDGDRLQVDPVSKQPRLPLRNANGSAVAACDTNVPAAISRLNLIDCDADATPTGADARCATQALTPASDDLAALVRFMKSLTDPRVQCDAAPFDHPELTIVHGAKTTDADRDKMADDISFQLPATGAAGYAKSSGYCIPNAGDLFAPGMQSRSGGARVALP